MKKHLDTIEKITKRLEELASKHHDLMLRNAELNHTLRENEASRVEELARFAHEMKKPLAVIRGLVTQCNPDTSTPSQMKETGKEIDLEITRAAKLLDNMITLAYLEFPKETVKQSIDFSSLCENIFNQQKLHFPKHHFASKIQPKIILETYPENLFAIVENLLENSGKHTKEGSKIKLLLKKSKGEVILEVEDDGEGFADEMKGKLTNPFYGKGKNGGSGLGLAVVSRAVDKLCGKLEIESKEGVGSKFVVRIPI